MPQKSWTEEVKNKIQVELKNELDNVPLQKDGLEKWKEQKDDPHQQNVFDLSSLDLSYQGQRLKSLEIIYSRIPTDFEISPTSYCSMKLTMMDSQHYFSFSDDSFDHALKKIVDLVQPFLSGKQCERDRPGLAS